MYGVGKGWDMFYEGMEIERVGENNVCMVVMVVWGDKMGMVERILVVSG